MSLLQTPVSLVDGIAEESLRFKESFAVVCIPLRSMRGTWTTSTICNYDEDRMHLRRLRETSLMQPVTEPTAASRLNSRPSACGFDARNAFTTAPADFAFGAVSSCPSFYRGEQYDADLGLYYLRARYYNTMTGRFVSMDPENGIVTDPKTLHKYLYTSSDPVNRIDPSGRSDLLEGTMIFALETVKAAPLLIPIAKYVNCVLHTAAVTLDLAIPPDGYHLEYLMPNLKDCTAKARYCKDGDSDCDDFTGTHGPWHYGNWCGAGGAGTPIDSTDAACMRHDKCYDSIGFAADQYTSGNLSPSQMQAAAACNQQLCNAVKNANSNSSTPPGQRIAGIQILGFFTYFGPAGGRCR